MSIAAHPGFERALADSAGTASQAIWLTEWMRLGEQVAEARFRFPTAAPFEMTVAEIMARSNSGVES